MYKYRTEKFDRVFPRSRLCLIMRELSRKKKKNIATVKYDSSDVAHVAQNFRDYAY